MKAQTITGATRLVALVGNPVAHSLSPLIHNHVYAELGLTLAYVPMVVNSANLHTAMLALRACEFTGANVTIPHKQAVLPYCDTLSPLSKLTGAVNTLYFKDSILNGTTTDWEGFRRALQDTGHNPAGGNVVILGNGGAARTIAFGFASEKIPARLTVGGRDGAKAKLLANEIEIGTGFSAGFAEFLSDTFARRMREATLCINCTSVGMHPDVDASPLDKRLLHKGITMFDTVYNPDQTLLCRHAEAAGCAWSGGLRMLVYQALASIEYWTGRFVNADSINFTELQAVLHKADLGRK
jgi:shikimate dehydrogenase